jgi:hypothetical protein
MIISKLLGGLQTPPQYPHPSRCYGLEHAVINQKTFADLQFVKCHPCECHDFVNQFILTIQLYYIFFV